MAFDPSKYTVAKGRTLPVILLLDVSGSMCGEKINTLNEAVNTMIDTFKKESQREVNIQVGIITFGDRGANYALPLQDVAAIAPVSLQADGGTPMGAALRMAKDLIEDKSIVPSNGYRPTVVLASDGEPNDDWQQPMQDFISDGRTKRCDRMAMAIGTSQTDRVLNKFITGSKNDVFLASDASKIKDFFNFVTMSVSVRSKSVNPNAIPQISTSIGSDDSSVDLNKKIDDMMDF